MNKLVNDLKYPVKLYGSKADINELNEDCYTPEYIKGLWADITPTAGKNTTLPGDVEGTEITHLFVVRSSAMPTKLIEPYFEYGGEKYHVKYIYPHFKQRDRLQVYCKREEC